MLSSLKIRTKLMLVAGLTVAGLLLVAFFSIDLLRSQMMDDRRDKIRSIVTSAISTADYYHKLVRSGEMSEEDAREHFNHAIRGIKFDDGIGYMFSFDSNGVTQVQGGNPALEGKNLSQLRDVHGVMIMKELLAAARGKNGGFFSYHWNKPGKPKDQVFEKLSYAALFAPWQMNVGTGLYVDDIDAKVSGVVLHFVILFLVIGLATIGLTLVLSQDISKSVRQLSGCMKRIAGGDLDSAVTCLNRNDELGEMASTVETFRDQAAQNRELERKQIEMKEQSAADSRRQIEGLAQELDSRVKNLVGAMTDSINGLHQAAGGLVNIANATSEQSGAVAAATEQTSRNVDTVASAAEELTASSDEIGMQVTRTAEIASRASQGAADANVTVGGLADATGKIGEVVNLINDIASQTNLLALNATIEAARAGEAGKGFAVVASEVKNLANQTTRATDEIASQIQEVTTETDRAVAAIKGINAVIIEVRDATATIASAVEEQHAAIQEIARNVGEASSGTREVAGHISSVSSNASETLDATTQVNTAGDDLVQRSQELENAVEVFVTDLRRRAKESG